MLFTHLCQGRMKPWWSLRNIPGLFLRIGGLKTSQSNGVFQHTERTPPVINQPSDWGLHLFKAWVPCCSVAKLWPHGLQRTRVLCPPLSPGVCSNSWPLSQWCHPTISSSATPFSSYPQSFPASGSFPMSQLFASGGQSVGASALVLPMNMQVWFPLGLTGLISLQSKGLSNWVTF